jgi:hypothetical protein
LTSWLAAGLAGGLAFAGCLALQALILEGLVRLGVAQPLAWIAVLLAPPMEEWAKWRARSRFGAPWARTGLAFGAFEALLKPLTLGGWMLAAGVAVALVQHTAYGGWARRRGLRFVIPLHMGFNALVLGASVWLGPAMWFVVLPVAVGLLALSRRRDGADPCRARLDAGKPPP